MGERLICIQKVIGSIPFASTSAGLRRFEVGLAAVEAWVCCVLVMGTMFCSYHVVPSSDGRHGIDQIVSVDVVTSIWRTPVLCHCE